MKTIRIFIEDPVDSDAVDPFRRPWATRPERDLSPLGTGTYLLDCECGRPFRSNNTWAPLCPLCEAECVAHYPNEPVTEHPEYDYRQVGRGRYRD